MGTLRLAGIALSKFQRFFQLMYTSYDGILVSVFLLHKCLQSLVMVFVSLLNHQLETILDFLSGVPDPRGKSALHFIMTIWCARQPEFYGVYDSKVR